MIRAARLFSKVPLHLVKQLRAITQAPYSEIQKALQQTNSDFKQAQQLLNKKGIADATSRASHKPNQGVIAAQVSDDRQKFVLLQVNCQTDFVAKSDVFLDFVGHLTNAALHFEGDNILSAPHPSFKSMEQGRSIAISQLKENILIQKVERRSGQFYGEYVHSCFRPGIGLKGSIVQFNTASSDHSKLVQIGDTLALQVLGCKPQYYHSNQVPDNVMDHWKKQVRQEMAEKLSKLKPEVVQKVVEGRMRKAFYSEKILEWMPLISDGDGKMNIGEYIKEAGLQLQVTNSWVWQI